MTAESRHRTGIRGLRPTCVRVSRPTSRNDAGCILFVALRPIEPMMEPVPFRLATWPALEEAHAPYIFAFYDAVRQFDVVPMMGLLPTTEWVRENRASVDAIHIHWPDGLWRRRTRGSITAVLKKTLELGRFLRAARAAGLKIIWTVHNMARHDGATWLDRYCYRMLAAHVDLFICHSRCSAQLVSDVYSPKGQTVVVPHGSFPGVYPEARPRDVVLRELGLRADRPTICAVGNLRVYKGIDVACQAVLGMKGAVQLIIGGKASGRLVDIDMLRESLSRAGCGIVIDRLLEPQEFADVVGASDAVLLPYRNITTSGVLLTAWTLGRGVIASDLPYFREISAPQPDAARLFAPGDAGALRDAIHAYILIPPDRRTAAALSLAAHYAWERCVEPLSEVFSAWRRERQTR